MKYSYMRTSHNRMRLPAVLALTGGLLLSGCLTPTDRESETPAKQSLSSDQGFQALEFMGISRDRVVEKPDGYIVDGDMFFAREDLTGAEPLAKEAQRRSTAISSPSPAALRLAIHSSMSDYAAVIHQAVAILNSVKTRLHIEVVPSGSGDITIYSDVSTSCPESMRNLGTNTHAIGRVASGGNPGSAICVNKDNSQMLATARNRVSVVAHEIGHTIGFRHTNSTDGTHITGTATTDANSLMNTNGTVAQGILTVNDILAMEILYPSDKPLGGTNLDGDTKDDIVVWRPTDGNWFALRSNNNFASGFFWQWGQRGDMPIEDMDMDGDGKDDKVVWRPGDGFWHAVLSSNGSVRSIQWGQRGDIPIGNHNMDGDTKDDLVVWRWTDGRFYVLTSSSNYASGFQYNWGTLGDIPVGGVDTDKDGKDDWVIWRPTEGRFYSAISSTNFSTSHLYNMGQSGDIPVGSNDLDRDGKDDLVLWRPSNGTWYAATSSSNLLSVISNSWGQRGDVPLVGSDIDQDGKRDITVWRPTTAVHWVRKSSSNFTTSVTFTWGQ